MGKFYITTSIPYVNDQPHIGFAMELVQADVLARYARQQGLQTLFTTGTDEHGGKIAEKATENKQTPQEFTDKVSDSFRQVLPLLNISNDRFIRTTDPAHEQRAQLIWQNLAQYIYKAKYTGWYCTGDEAFFPEKVVKKNNGVCPVHNRPYEKIEEENYFFKLSAFTDAVKENVEKDVLLVLPRTRKNEIMAVLNTGLEDISISRPKEKIGWGIQVPGDDSQVMYVWFEALMNYITVLGYPEHEDFKSFWPANIQIIGKDILRFHVAIWPAMLLALNLPLPKTVYAHGFITVDDKKMSKSLGNVISPKEIVDKYGADAFRYFFLRHIPSYGDGDFSWQRLDEAYNSELADQLGNAVSRTAAMVTQYEQGVIGTMPDSEHDVARYEEAIESCRFDQALADIWEQVKGLNQYIDEQKPWQIAKGPDKDYLRETLAYMCSSLLEIAELLVPFMPQTAEKIKTVFGTGVVKPTSGSLFPKQVAEAKK
jgi:methionyl-tRNA synthetase